MSLSDFVVSSRLGDYEVHLPSDESFVTDLARDARTQVVVDDNAWRCHSSGCLAPLRGSEPIVLPVSEELKTLDGAAELCRQLVRRGMRRSDTLLSVGGGIIQDVSGFAASTLYRGVRWVYVPSTLLAQVDSCIGAKTSLNFGEYKNLLGTFYAPAAVWIHAPMVLTQTDEDFASGLGELAKLHLLGGEASWIAFEDDCDALLRRSVDSLKRATADCLLTKRAFIEDDEFDRGRRQLLNFGHCVGHAMETSTDFAVPHGQAVVAGMVCAGYVARRRGLLSAALERRVASVLSRLLPSRLPAGVADEGRVIEAMRHDKKRTGAGLAMVMLCDGFEFVKVDDLSEVEAAAAIADFVADFVGG